MGTTALRQLLKGLCNNSPWNYAVLWKLRHGSQMVLTWEDGYFNNPKPRELVESTIDVAYCKGASNILSPQYKTNTCSDSSEEYPVGLLVAGMSSLQYTLGEGIVGQVAYTRDHCWVSLNDFFSGKTHKCPEEWLPQLASGIKSILLVPVLPHGVVQLGSLEEVAEDINIIAYVKDRFNALHSVIENTAPFSLKKDFQAPLSAPLVSDAIEYTNVPRAFTHVKTEDLSIAVNSVDTVNLSRASQALHPLSVQDAYMPVIENLPEAFKYETEDIIDVPPISLAEISTQGVSIDDRQLELVESKLLELSCLMEELQAYSDYNNYNEDLLGESLNGIMKSYPAGDMEGEPSGGKTYFDMDNEVVSSFLTFPKDCELHKALGPSFRKHTNEKLWDSSFLVEDTCSTSNLTSSLRTEPPLFARGGDAGDLLEAVVANAYSGSDDTCNRSSFNSSTSFSGKIAASVKLQKSSKAIALVRDDSNASSHFTSACVTEDKTADSTSSSLRKMINTIFSKEQQERGCEGMQVRKGHRMLTISKRRAKPGDNQRPRPRDRQLIQDRVKELRELVPNGAKCSIDGLLDRTIQHMLYLRSVTDQAEKLKKLKECMDQEHGGSKNWKSTETRDNCQNGTSWAYEFGNEFLMCPILVEDLADPGHMLIEMLCNEHALFLEIAQVIRGLELTILNGVLENRSNNTWAHFIIKASKGFHRLDIFWPLMQLLQRKRNPISSKI